MASRRARTTMLPTCIAWAKSRSSRHGQHSPTTYRMWLTEHVAQFRLLLHPRCHLHSYGHLGGTDRVCHSDRFEKVTFVRLMGSLQLKHLLLDQWRHGRHHLGLPWHLGVHYDSHRVACRHGVNVRHPLRRSTAKISTNCVGHPPAADSIIGCQVCPPTQLLAS